MSRSLPDQEDGVGIPGRRTACSKAQYGPELCLFLFSLKKPTKAYFVENKDNAYLHSTLRIFILPTCFVHRP